MIFVKTDKQQRSKENCFSVFNEIVDTSSAPVNKKCPCNAEHFL